MKCLKPILKYLARRLFPAKSSQPEDIPRKLDAGALEKAMHEARFLYQNHAVDVKKLAPDEPAGFPKEAND